MDMERRIIEAMDGVTGDGVTGDEGSRAGVPGDGVTGDEGSRAGVPGDGVTGDGVTGDEGSGDVIPGVSGQKFIKHEGDKYIIEIKHPSRGWITALRNVFTTDEDIEEGLTAANKLSAEHGGLGVRLVRMW